VVLVYAGCMALAEKISTAPSRREFQPDLLGRICLFLRNQSECVCASDPFAQDDAASSGERALYQPTFISFTSKLCITNPYARRGWRHGVNVQAADRIAVPAASSQVRRVWAEDDVNPPKAPATNIPD
jgi:hypothetical protein